MAKLNHEDLRKLLVGGESETVEFKNTFDKEGLETAGAFANTRGGAILIGVSDARQVLGLQIFLNLLPRISLQKQERWVQRQSIV